MRVATSMIACLVLVGCATSPFSPKAGREAFFQEIIFPQESHLTARFDAYSRHSYMVDKKDLAISLQSETEVSGEKILGLYVIGPGYLDPLWTYYILAFFEEKGGVRLSVLVYSHARITGKGKGWVSKVEFDVFRTEFSRLEFLKEGWPEFENSDFMEFSYNILGVDYAGAEMRITHGQVGELKDFEIEELERVFNGMFERHESTYPRH